MKINVTELPKLVTPVGSVSGWEEASLEKLNSVGVSGNLYGVKQGDVVEFETSITDVKSFTRQMFENSNRMETVIAVLKNGKPDYLSINSLQRMDVEQKTACDFTAKLRQCSCDAERVKMLCDAGKITVTEMKPAKGARWQNGVLLEGQTTNIFLPVVE